MQVAKGMRVRLEYELRIKGGEVIESSDKSAPLTYVHGGGRMLPALEARLEGMGADEEKTGEIAGAEAFGPEDKLPTMDMTRAEFPKDEKLKSGRTFEAKSKTGQPVVLKIIAVDGDKVTVRLVHPLMGKTLAFRVKVLGVNDTEPPALPAGVAGVDLEEVGEE